MPHISFSEFKNWATCPFYHKLKNIDKVDSFEGNEYTAFGTAIHTVCENLLTNNINDGKKLFKESFDSNLEELDTELNENLVKSMYSQGEMIIPLIMPEVKKYFNNFEVVSVEEKLYEPIDDFEDYNFKGFIDAVIKTDDGKYHIIDWKTCSWGWNSKKRSDPLVTYQLTFYKEFFAKKFKIDPKNIETYFALLKRTAKNDNVEMVRITSGPKKTQNALKYLHKALHNITKQNYVKNRISCTSGYGCEFYKTKYCK